MTYAEGLSRDGLIQMYPWRRLLYPGGAPAFHCGMKGPLEALRRMMRN